MFSLGLMTRMDTKTITGIFCGVCGVASIIIALVANRPSRQKRWIFAYMGVCFFVFGGLEYFGIIHLESWR